MACTYSINSIYKQHKSWWIEERLHYKNIKSAVYQCQKHQFIFLIIQIIDLIEIYKAMLYWSLFQFLKQILKRKMPMLWKFFVSELTTLFWDGQVAFWFLFFPAQWNIDIYFEAHDCLCFTRIWKHNRTVTDLWAEKLVFWRRPKFENGLNHHGSTGEKNNPGHVFPWKKGRCGQNIGNLSVLSFLVSSHVTETRACTAHPRLPSTHIYCWQRG